MAGHPSATRGPSDLADAVGRWFEAERPPTWEGLGLEVAVDADEIRMVVELPGAGGDPEAVIASFRARTREQRVFLAGRAEALFGRKVSWGARAGELTAAFTMVSVPVMTRLRMTERQVLDTLIDAGVARSRSEALAWCVRLVADNEGDWIDELRRAFAHVEAVRRRGPGSRPVR